MPATVAEHRVCLAFDDGETIDISCRSNEDVVSAGLRQGVLIVSDCRSGNCGACRAFLERGQYDRLLPHNVHALSDEDEEAGWVLSCRLRPQSDLVLVFDYPVDRVARLSESRRKARVLRFEESGAGVSRLVVRTVKHQPPLDWTRGQHFLVYRTKRAEAQPAYPVDGADAGYEIDSYLALPRADRVAAAVFTAGEALELDGPFGESMVARASVDPIFVAGREGLPAALAMLRDRSRINQNRGALLIVDPELAGERSMPALVDANTSVRFGLDALAQRLDAGHPAELYLCGPVALNVAARSVLAARDLRGFIIRETVLNVVTQS